MLPPRVNSARRSSVSTSPVAAAARTQPGVTDGIRTLDQAPATQALIAQERKTRRIGRRDLRFDNARATLHRRNTTLVEFNDTSDLYDLLATQLGRCPEKEDGLIRASPAHFILYRPWPTVPALRRSRRQLQTGVQGR